MSEIDNIIVLTSEDGVDVRFEFLDLVEYNGGEYVVLLPADEEEADEVVILQVLSGPDEENEDYVSVEDDATLNAVFELFRQRNADMFNFM